MEEEISKELAGLFPKGEALEERIRQSLPEPTSGCNPPLIANERRNYIFTQESRILKSSGFAPRKTDC